MPARTFCLLLLVPALAGAQPPTPLREAVIKMIAMPRLSCMLGFSTSEGKLVFAGETPLLQRQLQEARKASEANPESYELIDEVTMLLNRLNRMDEARKWNERTIALFRERIQKNPDDAEAHRQLGYRLSVGEDEYHVLKALELKPTGPENWDVYARSQSLRGKHGEAKQAAEIAVEMAGKDDLYFRMGRLHYHFKYLQSLNMVPATPDEVIPAGIRLPSDIARQAERLLPELHRNLQETDALINKAIAKLRDENGKCGANTGKQCLELLMMRDSARLMPGYQQWVKANDKKNEYVSMESVELIRKLYPPDIDDPHMLAGVIFYDFMGSISKYKSADEMADDPQYHKRIAPYLTQLDKLSDSPDDIMASTAAGLSGFVQFSMGHGSKDANFGKRIIAYGNKAIARHADFEAAWVLLCANVPKEDKKEYDQIAHRYVDRVGSATSYYVLALSKQDQNDWKAVEQVVLQGLKKYPNDVRLKMFRMVYQLKNPTDDILKAMRSEFDQIYAEVMKVPPSEGNLTQEHVTYCRLCAYFNGIVGNHHDFESAAHAFIRVNNDEAETEKWKKLLDISQKSRPANPAPNFLPQSGFGK